MGLGNLLYLLLWAAQGRDAGEQRFVRVSSALPGWTTPHHCELSRCITAGCSFHRSTSLALARGGRGRCPTPSWIRGCRAQRVHPPLPVAGRGSRASGPHDHERAAQCATPTPATWASSGSTSTPICASRSRSPAALTHHAPSRSCLTTPRWSIVHLAWLNDIAHTTVSDPSDTPAANLWDVASSRRLVITNSTFSVLGCLYEQRVVRRQLR